MKRLLILTLLASACSAEYDTVEQELPAFDPFEELIEAEPLDLSSVELGVGLRHGEAMALTYIGTSAFDKVTTTMPHAFLVVRGFDEASSQFGEFHVHPAPTEVTSRGITEFISNNEPNAFLGPRGVDLFDEVADAESNAGSSFASTSIIINFYRYRADWYARWDGNIDVPANDEGQGPYGFFHKAMVDDLIGHLELIAAEKPARIVIGDEVERLFADGGAGLAPGEFSNFLAFYRDAVVAIKAVSPDTKVGAGINYDRFLSDIVPLFEAEQEDNQRLIADAFEAFILPFAEVGDFFALRSYRLPTDDTITLPFGDIDVLDAYQFLRRVPLLFTDKKIVWYSIGSPTTSSVDDVKQATYLTEFAKWTGDTPTEAVSWRFAINYDGSDTANQQVSGRCKAFTETSRGLEAPVTDCFDGLFTSIFSAKAAFERFEEATQ